MSRSPLSLDLKARSETRHCRKRKRTNAIAPTGRAVISHLLRIDHDMPDLGIGESDESRMRFPKLSLADAIEALTLDAYGERLNFEHA